MPFNPRKLRHRVDIQRKSLRQDPVSGEMVETWTAVYQNVPAEIAPMSAREFIASQAMQSSIVARITIRYHADLDASMRIVHNGKIYNPQAWLSDADSGLLYMTAPCSEGVNVG